MNTKALFLASALAFTVAACVTTRAAPLPHTCDKPGACQITVFVEADTGSPPCKITVDRDPVTVVPRNNPVQWRLGTAGYSFAGSDAIKFKTVEGQAEFVAPDRKAQVFTYTDRNSGPKNVKKSFDYGISVTADAGKCQPKDFDPTIVNEPVQ